MTRITLMTAAALSTILGFAITVAFVVAGATSLTRNQRGLVFYISSKTDRSVWYYCGDTTGMADWKLISSAPFSDGHWKTETRPVAAWSVLANRPAADGAGFAPLILEQANGWPFLAAHGSVVFVPHSFQIAKTDGCIIDSRTGQFDVMTDKVFPMKPIWKGVVLNTGGFGLALFTIVITILGYRRMRRHQHHKCVYCGYTLMGLKRCPECGANIPRGFISIAWGKRHRQQTTVAEWE